MKNDTGPQKISFIMDDFTEKTIQPKPPTYEWQDLALRIIKELTIPGFKRNSVFKACKENSKEFIEKCLNDTKELCKDGEKWKYFFKLTSKKQESDEERESTLQRLKNRFK
jgi:hypothetical protein